MPKMRFTKLAVERLKPPPPPKQIDYFDAVLSRLILRVSYGGTKTWRFLYYRGGRPRTVKIGRYPTISLDDARATAREMGRLDEAGIDPRGIRSKDADTIDTVVDQFIERHAKVHNKTWREQKRILTKEAVSRWGGRPFQSITRRDVAELLDGIMDRSAPYAANRTLAALRKLFNWAVERGIVEASPVAGIQAPGNEQSRDRVLSDDEVRSLWIAWDQLDWPWRPYFKFLLLTGQRRTEVASMRWDDIAFDETLWVLPREFTKANRVHEVPLSEPVVEILQQLPRFDGPFVFSTKAGHRPISGYSKAKAIADKSISQMAKESEIAQVGPYRLHDLRRTAASGMARLGTPPHVLASILNHSPASSMGITAIYNRHRYGDEKRVALDGWARHVMGLIEAQSDNVVAIDRRRRANCRKSR